MSATDSKFDVDSIAHRDDSNTPYAEGNQLILALYQHWHYVVNPYEDTSNEQPSWFLGRRTRLVEIYCKQIHIAASQRQVGAAKTRK